MLIQMYFIIKLKGIIFVIDSTDTDHIEETKSEFHNILANEVNLASKRN